VLQDVTLSVGAASVHCLAGENGSGKSTLIKIISGTLSADAGQVIIDGHDATHENALKRIGLGLSVIYQDFSLLPNLTVFENITFLDSVSRRRKFANFRQLKVQAQETLTQMNVDIPLQRLVEDLSVANQQLVAIARALRNRSKIIIMDEPTSALTRREVKALFKIVRSVNQLGVSFIFVTHKLEEIYEICEEVTVLRNGQVVATGPIANFNTGDLSQAITGRQILVERLQPPKPDPATAALFRVESLSLPPLFSDVTFEVKAGEILGLTGLLGSGRSELAVSLSGKTPPTSGRILIAGQRVAPRSVLQAQNLGIAYIPEDRLNEGLFLEQEIYDNILIANLGRRTRAGLLDFRKIREDGESYIKQLNIKALDGRASVQTLSGGNQQRVLIARYLDLVPKVLILNGPTIGVDVGSKHDIHLLIAELARRGNAVIVVSDDLPEVLSICHRVIVMANGRIAHEESVETLDLSTLVQEVTLES
jgi:simple sugar transport system ATP-binding protein